MVGRSTTFRRASMPRPRSSQSTRPSRAGRPRPPARGTGRLPGHALVDQSRARGHHPDAKPVRGLEAEHKASTPMADYYPLISRAVGALEKNTGENRRVIYDRARAALLAQLRGVTPPLDESDITRERLALEESVRKVEAESARQFVEATRQMSAARLRQSKQWEAPPKARPAETRPAEPAPAQERERYIHPPAALAREPAAPAYAPAAPAY